MPVFVVATLRSPVTSPPAFSTQYRLLLSPRSMPIVNGSSPTFFFSPFGAFRFFTPATDLLSFFMAGLLFAPLSAFLLGAYCIPFGSGLLIPSRLGACVVTRVSLSLVGARPVGMIS